MKSTQKISFALSIALGSFALIGGTGLTVSSAWLITMAAQHPPVLVLGVAIVMVRFFGIFRSAARYGERVISHEAIFRKLTDIRVGLFSAIASRIRTNPQVIASESKILIDDVERAQEFYLRVTLPGISALIAGITTVLLAFWIYPPSLIWIIPTAVLYSIVIPVLVRKYLDTLAVTIEESENSFAENIAVAAHAMVEAEVFGYGIKYRQGLQELSEILFFVERKNYLRTSFLQFLSIFGIGVILLGFASSFHREPNTLPIHISMAIFLALVGFEGYTTWFPNLFPAGKNRRAAESVQHLVASSIPEMQTKGHPLSSRVEARNLIPYWSEKFLAPCNFDLEPGETLVITGPSGIGKSTLAASIVGFAPYLGSLTIGGVEVREIDGLSQYVTGTLQESHIFNTTLRENLKIANQAASDSQLKEILNALELSAIGLDEVLGEFGRNLSGGEAKRLAVARALLSSASIVILDEPLEHLDHERAQRIQESIHRLSAGKTLIVITHSPWLQYSRKLELARE
jgi:ABC-type transport system involved in cytochrome bd biosynthesis fused ATPase/permease subunit